MRASRIGTVVIAAVVLAACKQQEPAPGARTGAAVAERQSPAGSGAERSPFAVPAPKPAGTVAGPAVIDDAAWVARGGGVTVDEREYTAYALLTWPTGFEGKSLEERRGLAKRLILRKAAALDAEKEGLGKDPVVAKAEMEWKLKNYPPLYWAETVEKEVQVSDKELRAILKPRAKYLLGAIVFGDDAEGEARVRSTHAQLAAGGDFQSIAREQSEGFLAAKGGEMEWATIPNFMIEEKEAAVVDATKPGAITEPLLTRLGWTIFKVRDRVEVDQVFAEMKAEALPELRQQRIEEARAQRIAELRKRASIHYPAEMPNAMKNAPAAVVNGFVFPAGILGPEDEPHGGVTRAVTPPKKLLEQTINTLLVVLEAESIGIADRPAIRTNLALKRMDVLAQLKLRGESGGVAVTDAELRREYQRYYTQDTYEFQFIVTPSRERAAKALQRSRAGEEFDALAQEYNTGLLAKNKGVVPLGSLSVHPASVQAALPLLKDGEVSEVLDLGNGSWGVIKRTSQQFFLPPPFEEVSDKIRRRLELQKSSDRVMALAAAYEKKLNVTFNESLLAKP